MRQTSPQPVWLRLGPSRHMVGYLLCIHLSAVLAVWVLMQGPLWTSIALLTLLASLGYYVRREGLRLTNDAVVRVHWRVDGRWWLTDRAGEVRIYTACEPSLIHPWLTILKLAGEGGARWLLLPGDSANADALRRLRVRLLRQQPGGNQESPLRGT